MGRSICIFNYIHVSILKSKFQLSKCIETLYDQYYQQWYGVLNASPKLKYYSSFKTIIVEENYLNYIKFDKYRVALTRLRCSAHNLAIKEGRFRKIDRDDRKCLLCQMNVVESEYHFTLVCHCYRDILYYMPKKYQMYYMTLFSVTTAGNIYGDGHCKYVYAVIKELN